MPPRIKITKEKIINAGVEIVSLYGEEAINARAIAERLGASTRPIFSNFESMEEVRGEIIMSIAQIFAEQNEEAMQSGKYPPYKASGMSYIDFARREPNFFRLLFMRDRSGEVQEKDEIFCSAVRRVSEQAGISYESAEKFHLEMWTFVHGAAVMVATSYLLLDEELVSDMLTDIYKGLLARYKEGL